MKYLVEYQEQSDPPCYYVVDQADDVDHAVEQVRDAIPGCYILNVFGTYVARKSPDPFAKSK